MKRLVVVFALLLVAACASSGSREIPLPVPTEPIESLRLQLHSADADVRSKAAWDLAGAKALDPETRSRLEALLADESKKVRYSASWALGQLYGCDQYWDEPPRIEKQPRPIYPRPAFDKKLEGTVLVEVLIGEEGEVAHTEVRKSIPMLDANALACVRDWRFLPARRNGKAVPTLAFAPVTFRIY